MPLRPPAPLPRPPVLQAYDEAVARGRGNAAAYPARGEPFYPQNHVGRGYEIRNSAMGAVRQPKILVLTIDDPYPARGTQGPTTRTLTFYNRNHLIFYTLNLQNPRSRY